MCGLGHEGKQAQDAWHLRHFKSSNERSRMHSHGGLLKHHPRIVMKAINLARKTKKDQDAKPEDADDREPELTTKMRPRKGRAGQAAESTPVKTPARRVRRKGR